MQVPPEPLERYQRSLDLLEKMDTVIMEPLELDTLVLRDRPENKAIPAMPQIRAAPGQQEPLEARQACPDRRELPEPRVPIRQSLALRAQRA